MEFFKKIDHIGIVVKDLQRAMDELSTVFGLECKEQRDLNEAGIRVAFYTMGGSQMELVQFQRPLDDVDPIVMQPRMGVQHIAFQVENFDGVLKALTHRGFRLVKGFPRKGAHGMVAFFYPTKELDLLIEICDSTDS